MITIEEMQFKDLPVVSSIFIDSFNNSPVHEKWTPESSIIFLKEHYKKGLCFVAKENSIIIGAMIGHTATLDQGVMYYVDAIFMNSDRKNNGFGEQLLNKVTEFAKENKITSIQLIANAKLQSYSWYKRLGFEESGWIELVKTLV
jgi:L-amino acid N-acyltransferase YncA